MDDHMRVTYVGASDEFSQLTASQGIRTLTTHHLQPSSMILFQVHTRDLKFSRNGKNKLTVI